MANYTIELRYLYENDIGKQMLDKALSDYPIFDENYRNILNQKFINHFYFREICFKEPSKFCFKLNTKLKEIMGLYNKLYESETIDFNPLFNIDITETYEHENKTNGKLKNVSEGLNTNVSYETNSSNGESTQMNNDNPNQDTSIDDIKTGKYLSSSNYNQDKNSNTGEINSTSNLNNVNNQDLENNTLETYTKKTIGSSAGLPFSKAIKQYREILIKVDEMLFDELECMFMQIW